MDAVPMTAPFLPVAVFYPLLIVTIILSVLHYLLSTTRTAILGNKMPGPRTVPFLGNALMSLGVRPEQVIEKMLVYDIYGKIVRVFFGPWLYVFLVHPRDIEIILGSHVHIQKAYEYKFFKPWLGEGLLISSGEKWRSHRKMIAPTFHLNILKSFVPLFYENSLDVVKAMRKEIGKEFDCHDYLAGVTVDILMETAMGIRNTKKDKTGFEYAHAVMKMCHIIHRRQYDLLLRMDAIFKFTSLKKQQENFLSIIHGLTSRVIKQKKEDYFAKGGTNYLKEYKIMQDMGSEVEEKDHSSEAYKKAEMRYIRDDLDEIDENDVGEKRRLAFLDLMLEMAQTGANLTDEEIKEEVDTIMFEGHDTTAAGSSFVLCLLGIHQDVQDRVMEELDEIFKGTDRQATFQDTLEMKYLERVILESLRLFPPVPAIARQINEDVQLASKDYIIPAGATIIIPTFKIHRDEDLYPNAEVFNPDNFLPEEMQKRHYYAYIPFSAGPRSCVGRKYAMLKLKVLLSTILRNYRILSDLTEKDFRLQADIILKRTDGFRIKIQPRNSAKNGHDTTAAGSSFVLCLLGIHQDVQDRVMEELDEIFKGTDRQATFQDTLEMKYLERVILESLRLFPPVPAIARQINEDVQLASKDYVIPAGATIIIPTYRVHRDEDLYSNAKVFDPDNFLPEKMQQRHYYAYIPFSAGPRSCVGRKYAMLKLKVLLSMILRNYRILSNLTENDFHLQADIILKRTDGFKIVIEPRN